MVFEKTEHNYIFIVSVWIFTLILDSSLSHISNDSVTKNTPEIVSTVTLVSILSLSVYLGIVMFAITYFGFGPKLVHEGKNYALYGLQAVSTLAESLFEIISFNNTPMQFIKDVWDLESFNMWTFIAKSIMIPSLSILIVWLLRNQKLKFRDDGRFVKHQEHTPRFE